RADASAALRRQFGPAEVVWIDRRDLRAALPRGRVDAAVLVARDLSDRRLRLTSLLLALPWARERWRLDLRGGRERWSVGANLQGNALAIGRHLLACAMV